MRRSEFFRRSPKPEDSRFSFRWKFSSFSFLGNLFYTLLIILAIWFVNRKYHLFFNLPFALKLLVASVLFAAAVTYGLSRVFIEPVAKLTDAMNQVAQGDFSVKLETHSKIKDIRRAYASFNLMVQELSDTETLQTDFVSNVSHEFKTPLSAVEGYASLLQDTRLSQDERNIYIEKIISNTRRLSELVGNILLLSKISHQSLQTKLSEYSLDEQIRQCILALESKWEPKNIDFDIDLEEISYIGLENLMNHVWLNLIDNAVKFSPSGGTVKIKLYEKDASAVFSISNNGALISEHDKEHIFSKFYQGDTSRRSEGNGLGLALAKNIVDQAEGKITVESDPESGTVFTVVIPLSFPEEN